MNDTERALGDLAEALSPIRPDEVHINLPSRPPVETWVKPPNRERLTRAVDILIGVARVVTPPESAGSFDLSCEESVVDAIVGIITRHPMRQDELEEALAKWTPHQVSGALDEL